MVKIQAKTDIGDYEIVLNENFYTMSTLYLYKV